MATAERSAASAPPTPFDIGRLIRDVPDFPQPGILFKDITTLIREGPAFKYVVDQITARYLHQRIQRVVAIESRGFIFAAPIAYHLGAGFVPVRKPGKLPWESIKTEYQLEYGSNVLEIHKDALDPGDRVLIVDDVLATGGSAAATVKLVEALGGNVTGIAVVAELGFLHGRDRLPGYDVTSLITF